MVYEVVGNHLMHSSIVRPLWVHIIYLTCILSDLTVSLSKLYSVSAT